MGLVEVDVDCVMWHSYVRRVGGSNWKFSTQPNEVGLFLQFTDCIWKCVPYQVLDSFDENSVESK